MSNLYSHFNQPYCHIHFLPSKKRKAHYNVPVPNTFSCNWGLTLVTFGVTEKWLYVQQLFISLPSRPVAKHSQAVSIHHAGTLCLSGNVIHFRRQTVVHCVRERQLIGPDGWRARGMLTGRQPWNIHEKTDEPWMPHLDILLMIISPWFLYIHIYIYINILQFSSCVRYWWWHFNL